MEIESNLINKDKINTKNLIKNFQLNYYKFLELKDLNFEFNKYIHSF